MVVAHVTEWVGDLNIASLSRYHRAKIIAMEFSFDITNLDEMAARLPELRALLVNKQRDRAALEEDIEQLRLLIATAQGLSRNGSPSHDAEPARPRRRRASPAQDRAVQALTAASEALAHTAVGPTSLYRYMVEHGMDVPKDPTTLGTNLWDAWRAGKIRRATNGVYLPLDRTGNTEVDYPLTDYYYAAERGLPVPRKPRPRG